MIKADKISLNFDDNIIFNNLSFCIKEGEIVCISGPSGKGKTTLLRIICGLEKNFDGTLTLPENVRIGVVFQDDILLPWYTAKQNVSCVSTDDAAVKWLTAFGLEDSLDKTPKQLSGGMKRRVSLARACAFEPDILILDEAFKGLDSETKANSINTIIQEFSGKTIIFTSHSEDEIVMFSPRIIEL